MRMAPSPGRRPGKKRTNARRGVSNLGVEFYVEREKISYGQGGPEGEAMRQRETRKWDAVGRQIAAAMGWGDKETRKDEAYCRLIRGENETVQKEDQKRKMRERKERRREARQRRLGRRERKKRMIMEWRQIYEEWLWVSIDNGQLRQSELRRALLDLADKYLEEVDTEEVDKEVKMQDLEFDRFFNSCISESYEIADEISRTNEYLNALEIEMVDIKCANLDKEAISELIRQSTAPETKVSEEQTGVSGRPRKKRKMGRNLEDEVREKEEMCKLHSGEQDEKRRARNREGES